MKATLTVVVCVAGVTLTGCTSTNGGTPGPTSATTSQSPSNAPGAPKVTHPKNLAANSDSCQLLTEQQRRQLGVQGTSKTEQTPWGQTACGWRSDNGSMTLAPDTKTGKGLSQLYQHKDNFSDFTAIVVDGYPAVTTDKSKSSCALDLGVSDSQYLSLSAYIARPAELGFQDPCLFAQKAASLVLGNLPAGQ
ncbi:hypothetical protein KALB_1158 [Kutzneria albida DSM 43870]|uniref:Uncharacterized protein n=2 Tax=Kutzneria TaxID=43356 RepID=W5W1V1_9PSEU|nr:hypothetical protein KALB_1158 [Kutzneria albida DSM 43870]